MAVSGRKSSDFQCSLSMGSAEDFDKKCDPCQNDGHILEARGFCVNCKEYLCSNCFTFHKRTKASKHHQLLEKDDMDKGADMQGAGAVKAVNTCVEKCSVHNDEVIKFFCPIHEELGCHDCITLNHRTCKVDYIPDKCPNIGDSKEFKDIMTEINSKIRKTNAVMEKADVKDKEVEASHERATTDIYSLKKEIDKRIDMIQKQADERKTLEKQKIQTVLASCSSISTDMKEIKSTIEHNKAKNQNGQLFIAMKRVAAKLKSKEVQKTEESLEKTKSVFVLQQTKELDALLSGHDSFGTITDNAELGRKVSLNTLTCTFKENINVKTSTDRSTTACDITGCEVLSPDKLVITDYNNCKVKIVDINKKCVTDEKALDSNPSDLAVLPDDLIAVTLPNEKRIAILNLNAQLFIRRNIQVKGLCIGILYHQNHMYVVCQVPCCLLTLDMDGNVKSYIPLADTNIFRGPNYVVAREDFNLFYISSYRCNTIAGVTTDGKVSAVYEDKSFKFPLGMAMLDDGSLLVCCRNKTVHHVSGDLKQGTKIQNLSHSTKSICYNSNSAEVYVVCGQCDHLEVFNAQ